MDQSIIIDTGPLVAFFSRRDEYHHWVLQQLSELRGTLLTTESVLSESLYLLGYSKLVISALNDMVDKNHLHLSSVPSAEFSMVLEVMMTYQDLPASVADASLMVVYNELETSKIFTLDSDFLIYRAKNGKPPELIAPF